jgi:hypothetical protein
MTATSLCNHRELQRWTAAHSYSADSTWAEIECECITDPLVNPFFGSKVSEHTPEEGEWQLNHDMLSSLVCIVNALICRRGDAKILARIRPTTKKYFCLFRSHTTYHYLQLFIAPNSSRKYRSNAPRKADAWIERASAANMSDAGLKEVDDSQVFCGILSSSCVARTHDCQCRWFPRSMDSTTSGGDTDCCARFRIVSKQ